MKIVFVIAELLKINLNLEIKSAKSVKNTKRAKSIVMTASTMMVSIV